MRPRKYVYSLAEAKAVMSGPDHWAKTYEDIVAIWREHSAVVNDISQAAEFFQGPSGPRQFFEANQAADLPGFEAGGHTHSISELDAMATLSNKCRKCGEYHGPTMPCFATASDSPTSFMPANEVPCASCGLPKQKFPDTQAFSLSFYMLCEKCILADKQVPNYLRQQNLAKYKAAVLLMKSAEEGCKDCERIAIGYKVIPDAARSVTLPAAHEHGDRFILNLPDGVTVNPNGYSGNRDYWKKHASIEGLMLQRVDRVVRARMPIAMMTSLIVEKEFDRKIFDDDIFGHHTHWTLEQFKFAAVDAMAQVYFEFFEFKTLRPLTKPLSPFLSLFAEPIKAEQPIDFESFEAEFERYAERIRASEPELAKVHLDPFPGPTDKPLQLMRYQVDVLTALVAMGHVNSNAFRRALISQNQVKLSEVFVNGDSAWKYTYAIFGRNEQIILDVDPDEPGAKPVTASVFAYLRGKL